MYIPSYYGTDAEKATKRKEIHRKQIKWALAKGLVPVVYAQAYTENDYIKGVTYLKGDPIHPGGARNFLLDHFYASDDDFCLMVDDDTTLYEDEQHGTSGEFINIMRDLPVEDFEHIDIIAALNPSTTAFTEELKNEIYKDNLVFEKARMFFGPFSMFKNFYKHHGIKLYYDVENFTDENGKIITCEEHDFCINAINHGMGVYKTSNIIYKEMGRQISTWVTSDKDRNVKKGYEVINAKYGKEIFKFPMQPVRGLFEDDDEFVAPKKSIRFQWQNVTWNPDLPKRIVIKFK